MTMAVPTEPLSAGRKRASQYERRKVRWRSFWLPAPDSEDPMDPELRAHGFAGAACVMYLTADPVGAYPCTQCHGPPLQATWDARVFVVRKPT